MSDRSTEQKRAANRVGGASRFKRRTDGRTDGLTKNYSPSEINSPTSVNAQGAQKFTQPDPTHRDHDQAASR